MAGTNDEPVNLFSGDDKGMQDAIREAQRTFNDFRNEIMLESRRVVPAITECLIKYAFLSDSGFGEVEHMFLSEIEYDGKSLIGRLASEPMHARKHKLGDLILVEKEMVSDWLYVINGKSYGGFTFKYMWTNFTSSEKLEYRDEPPFCWLEL